MRRASGGAGAHAPRAQTSRSVRRGGARNAALLLIALAALIGSPAGAQQPNESLLCPPEAPKAERTRFLRALSLDLRGHVPTPAEHAAIAEQPFDVDVPEDLIDEWLASEAFVKQVVRLHRGLLWNNLSNLNIVGNEFQVNANRGLWRTRREARYRPAPPMDGGRYGCVDRPAEFNPDGSIVTWANDVGVEQEGWVEVSPYWAPDQTIRVCAFDAQERRYTASGTDCSTPTGARDTACGCGPNLVWCRPGNDRSDVIGFGKSIELLIAHVLSEGGSYLDLFSSRVGFVNGPLVHFYKHHARAASMPFTPLPVDVATLPDLAYTDRDTWVQIDLPAGHAGVLTHPGFLLRFQTNRARANRFYEAFLCQPFSPPADGLGAADPEQALNPDLQQRPGCSYCHAGLEPAAAHWGRWSESGAGFLTPERFPLHACEECLDEGFECPEVCSSRALNQGVYLTRASMPQEGPYVGRLRTARFIREEHLPALDQGPAFLARATVGDNRFPDCAARRTAEWLLGREIGTDVDEKWIDELARAFVQSGFKYRALVKAIVTDPRYRRIR